MQLFQFARFSHFARFTRFSHFARFARLSHFARFAQVKLRRLGLMRYVSSGLLST